MTPKQLLEAGVQPNGTYYSLPKGIMTATLTVVPNTASFAIDVGKEVEFVPDPKHRYLIQYRPLPNFDDDVKVTVNERSFVSKIEVMTSDRTGDVIVALAKSLSAFQPLEQGEAESEVTPLILAQKKFDPADDGSVSAVMKDFNSSIGEYIQRKRSSCERLAEPGTHHLRFYGEKLKAAKAAAMEVAEKLKARKVDLSRMIEQKNSASKKYQQFLKRCFEGDEGATCEAERDVGTTSLNQTQMNNYLAVLDSRIDQLTSQVAGLVSQREKKNVLVAAYTVQGAYCAAFENFIAGRRPRAVIEIKGYRQNESAMEPYVIPASSIESWHSTTRVDHEISENDCSIGVCYRPKEPYRINYYIEAGGRQHGVGARFVELPNKADIVAIDIRRAFLVTKTTNISFDSNGFLKQLTIDKPSELLAASKLPLEILSAVVDGFKIRADIITQQKNAAEKEIAYLKARAALAATQARSTGPALETGISRATSQSAIAGARSIPPRPVIPRIGAVEE